MFFSIIAIFYGLTFHVSLFYKEKLLTRSIFLLIYTSKNNITTFFLMLYDMNFTRSSKDYPDPDWFMGKH